MPDDDQAREWLTRAREQAKSLPTSLTILSNSSTYGPDSVRLLALGAAYPPPTIAAVTEGDQEVRIIVSAAPGIGKDEFVRRLRDLAAVAEAHYAAYQDHMAAAMLGAEPLEEYFILEQKDQGENG
jgi:hypothetical protein